MKIVYTSDLHGIENLYHDLHRLVIRQEARILIIGGDMLPKHGPLDAIVQDQRRFITGFLTQWLTTLRSQAPDLLIYTMFGNDDCSCNMDALEDLESQGLIALLHGKSHSLGKEGYKIAGFANCPPTPFSLKDWERRDTLSAPLEPQHWKACISSRDKGLIEIDADTYFNELPSIEEELERLFFDVFEASLERTIFVSHAPPHGCGIDTLYDGRPAGSRAIRRFIEKQKPLVALHGHIHEAPAISGTYATKLGETLCINPGQSPERLHAVVFQAEELENSLEHTVFGK